MVAETHSATVVGKIPNGSENAPKGRRSCKIVLLDGSEIEIVVDKAAKGSDVFDKVTQRLNLWEKDYFGLTYRDSSKARIWLNCGKRISKQVKDKSWVFWFEVKFYPPEPNQLQEDITRYYLCQQVQKDVASGKLPCSMVTYALLGSYLVQSQLGDYDRIEQPHGVPEENYLLGFRFAPYHSMALVMKVCELHKAHRGMSSAEAESRYLEISKSLSMYGVDLHPAKDLENADVALGVCSSGLLVYKDQLRVNRFTWPKILKISFRRTHFYIKIRPGGFEQRDTTVGFRLDNYKAAERLWKCCVEHHTFFRLMSPEPPPKKTVIGMGGSQFRFSGRTYYQARLASALMERQQPHFQRSQSARFHSKQGADGVQSKYEANLSHTSESIDPFHYYVNSSALENASVENVRPQSATDQLPLPVYSLKRDKDLVEYALPATVFTPPHKEYYIIAPQKSPSVDMERNRSPAEQITVQKPVSPTGTCQEVPKVASPVAEKGTLRWLDSSVVAPAFEQVHPSKSGLIERMPTMKPPVVSPTRKRLSGPNDKTVMEQVEQVIEQEPTSVERVTAADGTSVTTTSSSQVRTVKRIVQRQTVETFHPERSEDSCEVIPLFLRIAAGPLRWDQYGDHVERSIDVYSDGDIDHDAELTAAILEATRMDPSYTVEKIEVKRHGQC